MKRIQIMLTAVTVFTVVNGVLAFKAKFGGHFCTAALEAGRCPTSNICPNSFTGKIGNPGTKYCYRATSGVCDQNTLCTTSDILTIVED